MKIRKQKKRLYANGLVRRFFPGASKKMCLALLWNATSYPFGSLQHNKKQLKDYAHRSNRNSLQAMALADEDLHLAMKEFRESHPEDV